MITFQSEDIKFAFKYKSLTKKWLKFVAGSECKLLGDISIVFCSDSFLLDINVKFLHHDYFTDIITFDYTEENILSGDLFISIETVRDNATFFGTTFDDELNRVIVHGLLHLVGYDDHTEDDIKLMRYKENYYLKCRESLM